MTDAQGPTEGPITMEFFDQETGEDRYSVVLTAEEHETYRKAAESKGMGFQDYMVELISSFIEEQNTVWVTPQVDAFGNITLEGAPPVDTSSFIRPGNE